MLIIGRRWLVGTRNIKAREGIHQQFGISRIKETLLFCRFQAHTSKPWRFICGKRINGKSYLFHFKVGLTNRQPDGEIRTFGKGLEYIIDLLRFNSDEEERKDIIEFMISFIGCQSNGDVTVSTVKTYLSTFLFHVPRSRLGRTTRARSRLTFLLESALRMGKTKARVFPEPVAAETQTSCARM